MENLIIGVDVDLTVVDSVKPWKQWYKNLTGHDIGEVTRENNDIEALMHQHSDPLSFWKGPIYDDLEAFPEAIQVLTELHNRGYRIVFISACFPEHIESKRMMLMRNFKFPHGFISTHDKEYCKVDYFIDDYSKYCGKVSQYNPDCKVFQFKTEINTNSGLYHYGSWEDFLVYVNTTSGIGI